MRREKNREEKKEDKEVKEEKNANQPDTPLLDAFFLIGNFRHPLCAGSDCIGSKA